MKKKGRISGINGKKLLFGLEKEFILIFGGGFLVIVLGLMIFIR